MLLSIDEFAERAGVHPSTLRKWLKAGGNIPAPIPMRAVGSGPKWRKQDVEAWWQSQLRGAPVEGTVAPDFAIIP